MAMAMAVTSSSRTSNYHVFLSFRGTDTRYGFTGNLYKALCNKGIHTFIDDEELQRGEEITPALFKAIEGSKIAITVLSKHYASSSFCLDELSTIIHCMSKGLLVIPVFYMVDPSDIRHHKGSYGDALAKHQKRLKHNMDKLQKWKEALRQVANLSGYHFKDGDEYEYKFIGSIVASVSDKINHPTPLLVADHPVGLESRVAEVMKLLDVESDDAVLAIGIHGMGGLGKSTLARAVYNNLIAQNFDGLCYLENVREKSNKNGLEHLQNMLLQEILRDKNINVTNWRQGTNMIAQRLQRKKVLLLLDDVDKHEQLEAIVGSPDWFGPGSRVIITTRDQQLLACHQVKRIYELKELNEDDALQLLTWKAFKKEKADPSYKEVLNSVLTYASGLPLVLEVIGSNLFGKSIERWESAINQYKRIPHSGIQYILKVSFDTLEEEEKSVFLEIACCLKGYELKEVEIILNVLYDDSMKHHIGVLVDKSLIKVEWGIVKMHNLIQEMGRQIDQKESQKEPEKRKRLWLQKDIIEVLKHNRGTSIIEIIYLDVPVSDREQIIEWDGNGFKEMKNLKILIIKNAKFSEGPKYLPNTLRVLEWRGYPSNCLPSNFQPDKFVMCKLPHGRFTSFELDRSSKMFENLTVLKFDWCKSLTLIPDLSHFSNLEQLSFKYCDNLVTVHKSIGHLGKVKEINAYCCRNLVSFPPTIHLTSLEELDLSFCHRLESFPEISGKMENIKELDLSFTPIKELPISFVNLVRLQVLRIDSCGGLKLPSIILNMPELEVFEVMDGTGMKWVKEEENEETIGSIVSSKTDYLCLSFCNLDDDFFSIIGFTRFAHVRALTLSGNNFTFLPKCIEEFQSLERLDVSYCCYLQEIRGFPLCIDWFDATDCISLTSSSTSMFKDEELYESGMRKCVLPEAWIPEWFDHRQSRGPSISLWFRNKLPTKILCLLIAPVWLFLHFFCNWPAPMVFINGKKVSKSYDEFEEHELTEMTEMDNTCIFELELESSLLNVALEKEWNHMEVTFAGMMETSIIKAMGIHVFKRESGREDIRFSVPRRKRILDDYVNSGEEDIQFTYSSRKRKRCTDCYPHFTYIARSSLSPSEKPHVFLPSHKFFASAGCSIPKLEFGKPSSHSSVCSSSSLANFPLCACIGFESDSQVVE